MVFGLNMRRLFFSLLLVALFAVLVTPGQTRATGRSLYQRLTAESGLDRKLLERLQRQGRFGCDPVIVAKNLKQSEYKAVYEHFLKPPALRKAAAFLERNRTWLSRIEKEYGVEAEVLTAIFLVESDFGRYPGRYRLVEVYSSLARCRQPETLKQVYRELKKKYPDLDYRWLQRRARKKSQWGYQQLVALLSLNDRLEVEKVKGSWAGAFGICQFLPSSCRDFAVDGDGNGKVDLYVFEDAAASVANYLQRNGWRPGLSVKGQEKVIWSYNHSRPYCETIVGVARQLAAGRSKATTGKKP